MVALSLASLEAANSLTEAPRGVISIGRAAVLKAPNSGLELVGSDTELRCTQQYGSFIDRGALAVHADWGGVQTEPATATNPQSVPQGQVAWLYNTRGDGTYLYPGPVSRFLAGDAIPVSPLTVTRAVKAVGVSSATLLTLPTQGAHPFQAGDDVFLTDGPLINELIPEWRRVVAITPSTVTLDLPPFRTYTQPVLCGGSVPRRITFRRMKFTGDMGPVFLAQAVDLVFEDCIFAANSYSLSNSHSGWLTIVGCGRLTFNRCKIESGLSISSSHDVTFRDCKIRRLIAEQAAYNCRILDGCEVNWLDSRIQCTGWTLRDSTFYHWLPVYDNWSVYNCVSRGPVVLRGRHAIVDGLRCPSAPYFEPDYQGHPPHAAEEVSLSHIHLAA